MTITIGRPHLSVMDRTRQFYRGAAYRLARWRRAWLYARNRLDRDGASRIIWDCQDAAEWWPLDAFDLDGVMEDALDRWHEFPELREIAIDACDRVHSKWSGTGDLSAAARDWALDLIKDYAEDRNIVLREREDDA